LGIYTINLLLFLYYKKLLRESKKDFKKKCKFKITNPKYRKDGNKKYAYFSVVVSGGSTAFFSDFPLIFIFYSDTRFKSRIKINYSTRDCTENEEILNKTVVFERHAEEFVCPINDIIPDQIHIQIEIDPEYGYPNAIFSIRQNPLCENTSELVKYINFPK